MNSNGPIGFAAFFEPFELPIFPVVVGDMQNAYRRTSPLAVELVSDVALSLLIAAAIADETDQFEAVRFQAARRVFEECLEQHALEC